MMVASSIRTQTLFRLASSSSAKRTFATSIVRSKAAQRASKVYESVDEAVADVPSEAVILSGGAKLTLV